MVSNLKIGIQTRSLRQPLKKALQTAARLGADGVEVDLRTELPMAELSHTSIRQFRKQLLARLADRRKYQCHVGELQRLQIS